jgi:hypothetical protein
MARRVSKKQRDSLVTQARKRLQECWENDQQNREDAANDLRFAAGDQWPENVRKSREAENRPVITVNKLPAMIHQVTNDIRQNKPSIKVIPTDGTSDPNIAEIFSGIIRQIEYNSSAGHIYSNAAAHTVACGIGHFRIVTDYMDDTAFDQEIKIKRIANPLSVYWDPASVEPDRSDAMFCFVVESMPIETFRAKYPKAKEVSVDVYKDNSQTGLFWATSDNILVAEYWCKKPVKKQLALMQDGTTLDVTDLSEEELQFLPIQAIREADSHKIEQSIVTGAEVLDGPNEWAGRYIPVVPIVGTEIPLHDQTVRHGMIRFARDPQRLYNYWRTAAAESIALAPKAPWLVTKEMIAAYKGIWDSANTSARPYLVYKPDPNAPGSMPKRERPADPPNALWQEGALASEDMKATTGIYDASLGAKSNETSGKAIIARQREGDTANFHYTDNLQMSLERAGRILIDLIPKIYDTERIVKILGEDESEEFVPINTVAYAENGEPVLLNDLSTGRYDVRVNIGASYATKRAEAADSMMQFIQALPQAGQVAGDLVAKNMDWPGAEDIAKRLEMLLPPEMKEDQEAQQPDPMQQAMQEMNIRNIQAETQETEAKANKATAEAEGVQLDNVAKKAQLEMNLSQ